VQQSHHNCKDERGFESRDYAMIFWYLGAT
jgi:hypothetical protein